MAFKSIAIPWLSGSLIVVGYAAFSWLRGKRPRRTRAVRASQPAQPLSEYLEHVPDELALSLDDESLPANTNALPQNADLGALFLGRASEALSAVPFPGHWPEARQ